MAGLTVENFVGAIKAMGDRERNKLRAEELIKLIIQLPDTHPEVKELSVKVNQLFESLATVQSRSVNNMAEIANLKDENKIFLDKNDYINNENILLNKKVISLQDQMTNVDQYLRVNNIEIAGLPDVSNDEVEGTILEALNGLKPVKPITSNDIDIFHVLPSQKEDGRKTHTHLCRFVSRKTKINIISAKREEANRNYIFNGNKIFINDHLTPETKKLFGMAKQKKVEHQYKHLWTRNGRIFMRKDDRSQIYRIDNAQSLDCEW